jgi:membrane protein involved in colicin uptake
MKNLVLALMLALGLFAITFCVIVGYNVWYADSHPAVPTPGAVEQGRTALHLQLYQASQREAEIEKLYWNEPEKLQVLIQSHQQRIDNLAGNKASSEIAAHDQQAIARLQQRIAEIAAQRQAQAEAEAEAAREAAQAQKAELAASRTQAQ